MSFWRTADHCRGGREVLRREPPQTRQAAAVQVARPELAEGPAQPPHGRASHAGTFQERVSSPLCARSAAPTPRPRSSSGARTRPGWARRAVVPPSKVNATPARAAPLTRTMRQPGSSAPSAPALTRPSPSCSRRWARPPSRPSWTASLPPCPNAFAPPCCSTAREGTTCKQEQWEGRTRCKDENTAAEGRGTLGRRRDTVRDLTTFDASMDSSLIKQQRHRFRCSRPPPTRAPQITHW